MITDTFANFISPALSPDQSLHGESQWLFSSYPAPTQEPTYPELITAATHAFFNIWLSRDL